MLQNAKGSPDGIRVIYFEQGQVVSLGNDLSEDLLNVFVKEGWAEQAQPKDQKDGLKVEK